MKLAEITSIATLTVDGTEYRINLWDSSAPDGPHTVHRLTNPECSGWFGDIYGRPGAYEAYRPEPIGPTSQPVASGDLDAEDCIRALVAAGEPRFM